MTFRARLEKEHSKCVDVLYEGGCLDCPVDYGYEKRIPNECVERAITCRECWDREIPEKRGNMAKEREIHSILRKYLKHDTCLVCEFNGGKDDMCDHCDITASEWEASEKVIFEIARLIMEEIE